MQSSTSVCPYCGAQISANAQFCRSCGKSITAEPTSAPRPAIPSAERKCPNCGSAVSADAKFCRECGKTISGERACPHCGAALSPTAQFCRACGKPIVPVLSQPSATRVATPSAQAPRAAKQPATPTLRRSGSKLGLLVVGGCAAVPMLCLIGIVGVFFAFRSGAITQETLLNLVGLGPATIEVMNFRDDAIKASVTLEKSEGTMEEKAGRTFALESLDFIAYRAENPGKYRIDLQPSATGAAPGTCMLTVRGGDKYLFIVLRNGMMVDRLNAPLKAANDLDVETSALCRK